MTLGMQSVLMWAALFIAGFLGHLIGDYLVQNGWMAANKAKPIWSRKMGIRLYDSTAFRAITAHAASWTMSVQATMIPLAWIAWGIEGATTAGYATLILGAIHWIQDRRWPIIAFMKATGKDHTQLWLLIVVDNVWHLVEIALAAAWIVWRMMY